MQVWEYLICLLLLLMFHSRSFHLPTRSAFQAACCRPYACWPVVCCQLAIGRQRLHSGGHCACTSREGGGKGGEGLGRWCWQQARQFYVFLYFRIALCNLYYAAMLSEVLSNSTKGSMEMGCRQQSVAALCECVCVSMCMPQTVVTCVPKQLEHQQVGNNVSTRDTQLSFLAPFSRLFYFTLYSILIYCFLFSFASSAPASSATCHFLRWQFTEFLFFILFNASYLFCFLVLVLVWECCFFLLLSYFLFWHLSVLCAWNALLPVVMVPLQGVYSFWHRRHLPWQIWMCIELP